MTDELERRLRSADPAAPATQQDAPADVWIQDLVEATMHKSQHEPTQHSRWLAVAACAAAVTVLGAGTYAVLDRADSPSGGPAASTVPAMQLALSGTDDAMASCVPFSAEMLAPMPVAFSGTASSVDGGTVLIEVDQWYRGGEAEEVRLVAPDGSDIALLGAVKFEQGTRYLVTASGGVVSSCGFTMEWDADSESSFQEAFGG